MAASFDGLRFSHWQTESREDGIVVLSLDRQGAPVNALSQDVLIELGDLIERIAIDPPKGVVIRSAKPAGFIAGADLKEFQDFDRKGIV
ncbi:MAG: enoyl-CoA hydratase-related protein, partial [Pseudoxanthomonas sp.]